MTAQERPRPLEQLWAGEFGDAYVDRNATADRGRAAFWAEIMDRLRPASVLEVGCNLGANLHWIVDAVDAEKVAGVDVNQRALAVLSERLPGVDARIASGRQLPFPDASFELVLTMGVLIHQAGGDLEAMMAEIVRCSSRYVLCGEYFDETEVEVPYRGERGALFRRDYGGIYQRLFPELSLVDRGFLAKGPDSSWDDVTWWLFEKPRP